MGTVSEGLKSRESEPKGSLSAHENKKICLVSVAVERNMTHRKRESQGGQKIKPITQMRFDALCYSRLPAASFIFEEVEWFADQDERVLGIVARHIADQDWAWAVLGRDANGLFRAIDNKANLSSRDEARKELHARLIFHAEAESDVFAQGDERKHTTRLFEAVVPTKQQHRIFKLIRTGAHHSSARSIMQEIANAFIDVDGNYVRDFQTSGFNARLWELYLFAFFHEQRFTISREFSRPDFLLEKGIQIAVEAATVNSTEGEVAPFPTSEEELRLLRAEYMPIKFGSSLFSKLKKRYWELPQVNGKPLLLAIHDFHSENSMTWSAPSLSDYLYGLRAAWHHDEVGKLHIIENTIQKHTWGKRRFRLASSTSRGQRMLAPSCLAILRRFRNSTGWVSSLDSEIHGW